MRTNIKTILKKGKEDFNSLRPVDKVAYGSFFACMAFGIGSFVKNLMVNQKISKAVDKEIEMRF